MSEKSRQSGFSPLMHKAFEKGYVLAAPVMHIRRNRGDEFGDHIFGTAFGGLKIDLYHHMFNTETGEPLLRVALERENDLLRNSIFSVLYQRQEGWEFLPDLLRPNTQPELRFVSVPYSNWRIQLVLPIGRRGSKVYLPAKPWDREDLTGPEVVEALSKSISEADREDRRVVDHIEVLDRSRVTWYYFSYNVWESLAKRALGQLPEDAAASIVASMAGIK